MFENIVGQDIVINLLSKDILSESLNSSMIFHGSKYTGRLTTALEFSRVVNCLSEKKHDCNCKNCIQHRQIDFNGMIYVGRRTFIEDIKTLSECYLATKDRVFYDKIYRYIKLVYSQFSDFLVNGVYKDSDLSAIYKDSETIDDIFQKPEMSSKDFDSVLKCISRVDSLYKNKNIPVAMMRNILDITRYASSNVRRVIIIDYFDHLEVSSANILLKRLEEASKNLYFILIAEDLNQVLQTIKSRCRPYYFRKLSKTDVDYVLKNSFKVNESYDSFADFFQRDSPLLDSKINPIVLKILNLTFLKQHSFKELILFFQTLQKGKDKEFNRKIYDNLSKIVQHELLSKELGREVYENHEVLQVVPYEMLKELNSELIRRKNIIETFYVNPILQLESIFYKLKEIFLR